MVYLNGRVMHRLGGNVQQNEYKQRGLETHREYLI